MLNMFSQVVLINAGILKCQLVKKKKTKGSSSTHALLDLNWINLSTRRLMQQCFLMHNFINDSERNSMIPRGSDYHGHKTRSKETIRSIRSNTNWGLLRSFNSALTDWNSLPEDMRCLPYNAFKISFLKNFKSQ